MTVRMACARVGLQTHTGEHACVSWRAHRHTPVDRLSPSWGSLLGGLPRVCFEDPAGAVTRWLSHGALGCMERLCLSCPRGILLSPCVFVGLLIEPSEDTTP